MSENNNNVFYVGIDMENSRKNKCETLSDKICIMSIKVIVGKGEI